MRTIAYNYISPCVVIVLVAFLTQSCSLFVGSDGKDGEVFISIDWTDEPVYYTDTNPAISDNFQRGVNYQTDPRSYEFEYAFEDDYGWTGTYTIRRAEPGESGSFFRNDGEDGSDAFYSLLLTYQGVVFENEYKTRMPSEKNKTTKVITAASGNYIIELEMTPIEPSVDH